MSALYWRTDEQMARLSPYFPAAYLGTGQFIKAVTI
jgi:hypothetical protein